MSGDDKSLFLQTMSEMKNLRGEMYEFRGEMKEFKESVKDRITKLDTLSKRGVCSYFYRSFFLCVVLRLVYYAPCTVD